ncbi:MAG: hypothetical protein L7H18_02210 [Candidatus Nealsonbacteria bacterium DGGOD1a]|nr:MAG: hypothetical protein L7H18_02210 [Candidatus Nealsonbacteria bacterium DGGOD1a]
MNKKRLAASGLCLAITASLFSFAAARAQDISIINLPDNTVYTENSNTLSAEQLDTISKSIAEIKIKIQEMSSQLGGIIQNDPDMQLLGKELKNAMVPVENMVQQGGLSGAFANPLGTEAFGVALGGIGGIVAGGINNTAVNTTNTITGNATSTTGTTNATNTISIAGLNNGTAYASTTAGIGLTGSLPSMDLSSIQNMITQIASQIGFLSGSMQF